MKKIINILIIITCTVLLTSCIDPYFGKRPVDYGEAIWTCNEVDMWFEVENEHSRVFKGQLTINDQTVDIEVWFMEHDLTSIEALNHGGELWGHSEFYPDQVILHIDEKLERDSIFYGKYEKLTFIRIEKQDSNTID